MASITFDATQVEPSKTFDVLPAGKYLVMITDSDVRPTRAGNGTVVKLTLDILDGQHKGRKIFDNINLQNANPEAQRIGQQQFSALCHAVGVLRPQDTADLHNKPVVVTISVDPAKDGYEARNRVKGYDAAGGGTFTAPAQHAAAPAYQAPAAAAPAANAAPWAKRA